MDYDARVIKGAELLDKYFKGQDWRNAIDLERLAMDRYERCVLGQLFGSYIDGLSKLELTLNLAPFEDRRECGFTADAADVDAWEKLDYEWKRYIEGTR